MKTIAIIGILSMEHHKECLSSLCRICSNRTQKLKDIINKSIHQVLFIFCDVIFIFYGIDVNQDNDKGIFPEKISNSCFEKMRYGLMHDHQTVKNLGEKEKSNISVYEVETSP